MQIIAATLTDIPALSELLSELFSQEEEFILNTEAHSRGLAQIISNPNTGVILIAREANSVLGMVNVLFTVSTALGAKVALLEVMVVSTASRGAGIGSKLLVEAITHAHGRGCKRITLLTDRTNQAAQRFYMRHGFRVSSMIPMRLLLE